MKTNNNFTMLVLIIFCHIFCNAQQSRLHHYTNAQWIAFHQKELPSIPYVIEGTVVQESWKQGTMLTCYVLKITKIYKGSSEIKIGSIKIMAEHNPHTKDGWKGLSKGSKYIIFGKMDSDKFQSITAENSLTISCIDYATISGNTVQWGGTTYNTIDNLYVFFKENGLTVQEEKK